MKFITSLFIALTGLLAIPDGTFARAPALVFDPGVRQGRLDNGLCYYIRENAKPEGRIELRLVLRAGSVLEDDDQQGLAHLLEHMAFNGTTHFKKQEMIDYLESIGMGFGPDLNAYTSFDETVYMLQVPTSDPAAIEKGFLILEDWAGSLLLEGDEIDKERLVVIEEWRRGRDAQRRIFDRQFPVLFQGSRYAERLPIGKKKVLEAFAHERLRSFYRDWYRPDLMAVVVVGDLNADTIEKFITAHFSRLPVPENPPERVWPAVPDHQETLYAIVTDPEASTGSVGVYYKMDPVPLKTTADYRQRLTEQLFNTMLGNRLSERLQEADPPYLDAFAYKGGYIHTKDFFAVGADVKEDGYVRGLESIVTEAERVRRHGFTHSELERTKKEMLRAARKAFEERHTTESKDYAARYVKAIADDEVDPGVETALTLHRDLLPGITLEEINRLATAWVSDANRVVLVDGPEKETAPLPDPAAIQQVFDRLAGADVPAYIDDTAGVPLLQASPAMGRIEKRSEIPELGISRWVLSNGATVILKPTDFMKDQVLLRSFSPGGHSRAPTDQFLSAVRAADVAAAGGLGNFSRVQLEKKLTGQVVQLSPYITELWNGLSGACSSEDLETLMQLAYLRHTAPRRDEEAFHSLQTRMKASLENRLSDPMEVFSDLVQVTLYQDHARRQPWTPAMADQINLDRALAFYRDSFSNARNHTFIIVGDFTLPQMEGLATQYLATLPAGTEPTTWQDVGVITRKGRVEKSIARGIENKSFIRMVYSGPFTWNPEERFALNGLMAVMRIRLREQIREAAGGTYHVSIYAPMTHYPRSEYMIIVEFNCDPERVDELTRAIEAEIEKVTLVPVETSYVDKVKEGMIRGREIDLKRNEFWLSVLEFYLQHEEDPVDVLNFEKYVDQITPARVLEAAQHYFKTPNRAVFVLRPGAARTPPKKESPAAEPALAP